MDTNKILSELGYTQEWLDWGIIDRPYLEAQYAAYCSSDDKNQEHYRWRAFVDFLVRNSCLTDDVVDRIFLLADDGPDGTNLADNRAIEVVLSGLLTDEQLFALGQRHPRVLQRPIERLYRRACLWRKICRSGIDSNLAEIQACQDRQIHRPMLDLPDLTRAHLEWLREAGANKSIRNQADALLRSKRFRTSQGQ